MFTATRRQSSSRVEELREDGQIGTCCNPNLTLPTCKEDTYMYYHTYIYIYNTLFLQLHVYSQFAAI